ncbi:MAG: hypothetical protein KatS3mg023_1868 [Armatimonadota bacterium]|nr:MAG: hypothetical protein KatS3mg023_1868 [Armatimonadota bacterium]
MSFSLVCELAEGQKRTDETVRELVESQKRTDETVRELVQSQRRTDEQIRQLTARVDDLPQRLEQLTARVEQLGQRLEELTASVASLARSMERVSQDVAKMEGYYLEQRYYQRAPAYFSKIVRRVRAVSYEDLCRLLDGAMDAGTLTEDERDDLIETDVVVYGRKRTDGEEVYLIVEVSWDIGPSDVSRASQRARTFSKLGWQTLPVVAGEWADDAKEAARRNGVVIPLDGGLVFGAV